MPAFNTWFPSSQHGADALNVKSFGALGDGSHDDTTNIQACLDAAYGTSGAPHGIAPGVYQNKPVYFPAGNYKITAPLTLRNVQGAHIFGAGRMTTLIRNVTTNGSVFLTNGCEYSRFELLHLWADGTGTCFDLDWDGIGGGMAACQSNTFQDMFFQGGVFGLSIGRQYMGSEILVLNCSFNLHSSAGLAVRDENALMVTVIGGNFAACLKGIWAQLGSVPVIQGVSFQNNTEYDIVINYAAAGDTYLISGCRTESPNFLHNSVGAKMVLIGCGQICATSGTFLYLVGDAVLYSCQSTNGEIINVNNASLLSGASNNFQRANYLANYTGYMGGAITTGFNGFNVAGSDNHPTQTVAGLPAPRPGIAGAIIWVTDSSTATPGAIVTGSGANQVLAYCNGTNWRVLNPANAVVREAPVSRYQQPSRRLPKAQVPA